MLIIIFSNLTLTTKFKKLAANRGINGVKIIQTPRQISNQGCSYAVKASSNSLHELYLLMDESALFPVAVYKAENLTKGKISYTKIK